MELTPKQAAFVREYLIDLNATQAAIRAGFSEKTAGRQAVELLNKTHVKAAVDAASAKRAEKLEISAERVLTEISRMAFYDPLDLIEIIRDALPDEIADDVKLSEDGKIITGLRCAQDIKHLPENVRRAIVGWGYDRNQNFTIKLADKSKALDQLARHLALYNDKVEVSVTDALAERLERAARGEK